MSFDNGTNLGDSRPTYEEKQIERLEEKLDQFRAYGITVKSVLADREKADACRPALELVLLFHDAGPWTEDKAVKWESVTGTHEATTRALCEHVRRVLNG